jgi:hypothetical protein
MKEKATIWQRIGLHDWFLKRETSDDRSVVPSITPNDVYKYILDKFNESVQELSFAERVVFYHEYIICFNEQDFKDFMDNKKGIFGLIVQESVKKFYAALKSYRDSGKTVEPSSSKWVFRFASHPDYNRGDKSFIGKLLPGNYQKEDNIRVTFIPRQTGIAQTFDINPDILKGFTLYSEGYYEVPYEEDFKFDTRQVATATKNILARLETTLPDKAFTGRKLEYIMKDEEIIVSGKDDDRDASNIFRIPSEWVSTPHLRIRYNKDNDKYLLASFGEKTIVNEKEVAKSSVDNPSWTDLPINSKLVLNGIISINIYKA